MNRKIIVSLGFMLLSALCSSVMAQDELSAAELRQAIAERKADPKFLKKLEKDDLIREQMEDLDSLVAALDKTAMEDSVRNADEIRNLRRDLASWNPVQLLVTPSDSVFAAQLPDESAVPLPLRNHYRLLLQTQQFEMELKRVNAEIEVLENALGSDPDAPMTIRKNKAPLLEKLSALWSAFFEMDSSTFSDEQAQYVATHLQTPYFQLMDKYYFE